MDATIVTLGEIADVVDVDAERVERLKSIQLVPAPVPGQTLRLEFGIVRSRLQAHGVNLADLEFSGRSVVEVRRADSPAPGESGPAVKPGAGPADAKQQRAERLVIAAVREHCRRHAPELGSIDAHVELRPDDVDRVLAAGAAALTVAGTAALSAGRQPLVLRYVGRNGTSQDIHLTVDISPRPWVLAAREGVPAAHRVQLGDLAWIQIESAEGLFADVEQLVGQETTRSIRAGEPVRPADVRSVPLVRSGEMITVSCRRAGIAVRRQMQARGDGARGDEITVVTPDGRERLSARVTGLHEAEVGYKPASIATLPARGPAGGGLRLVSEPVP